MNIQEELVKDKRRAIRRKNNIKKAKRKKKLSKEIYYSNSDWTYYDSLHAYSKNKIHCSCPICRAKTNSKKEKLATTSNRRKKNWTHSDLKKIEKMKVDLSTNDYSYTTL